MRIKAKHSKWRIPPLSPTDLHPTTRSDLIQVHNSQRLCTKHIRGQKMLFSKMLATFKHLTWLSALEHFI